MIQHKVVKEEKEKRKEKGKKKIWKNQLFLKIL